MYLPKQFEESPLGEKLKNYVIRKLADTDMKAITNLEKADECVKDIRWLFEPCDTEYK